MLGMVPTPLLGMELEVQKPLRKCAKEPNLKAHFRSFENSTTTLCGTSSDPEPFESSLASDVLNPTCPLPQSPTDRRSIFYHIGRPTLGVILPLTILAAVLTGLVIYGSKRINNTSLFQEEESISISNFFILVNVPNSWLLSFSSISSTMAGYMAPIIMMVQMYLNAQAVQQMSEAAYQDLGRLLTPYQLSLMLGLSSGSIERWWRFERYSRATKNTVPSILRHTAHTLKLSLVLLACIIIADQCLHYTTSTVQISQATETRTVNSFGRGLTEECLSMKREDNSGLPCSLDNTVVYQNLTEYVSSQNQIFYLQQGISKVSNIELVDTTGEHGTRLALLTPRDVSSNIDFRAPTIGVSVQCRPITTKCAPRMSGFEGGFTSFNCSENFWGVLGKALPSTAVDPDVPPLAFKWSKNLQIGFFMDGDLKIPYNSIGLDPSTGLSDPTRPDLPDSELINPVYFAIAGSFSISGERAGVNLSTDPSFWFNDYLNFVLSCSYQTLEVNYTSYEGGLTDFSIAPTSNGTIAEIYHGSLQSFTMGGTDSMLQIILATAALQPSGEDFASVWADLFSQQVLGVIGAFTSPRANIKEQSREMILVTKLPIPALVVLLVLNLAYMPIGFCLCRKAYKQASEIDVRDLYARLSVPGVITGQFGDDELRSEAFRRNTSRRGFDETKIVREAIYVQAKLNDDQEFDLVSV